LEKIDYQIMNRREALTLTTLMIGGTIIGSQMWCSPAKKKILFTDNYLLFLDEVGETILPKTDKSPWSEGGPHWGVHEDDGYRLL
jgi:hypothetical protein